MTIFCFGDSNTYGFDPRSYFGEKYPEDVCWVGRLRSFGWNTVNRGMNGREIPSAGYETDMAKLELRALADSDLLLIMLGGNDLLNQPDLPAQALGRRMREFVCALQADCRKVLIVPPKMGLGSWTADRPALIEKSSALSQVYRETAEELQIGFLDTAGFDFPLCSDGVHLLPEGHQMLADAVNRFLTEKEKMMERLPKGDSPE